jgi:hypothetical protein
LNKPKLVVLDSNACIIYALSFGTLDGRPVHDYYCMPVRNFVEGCLRNSVRIGYFDIVEEHAWANIVLAINDLAADRGIRPARLLKSYERVKESLSRLFTKLSKFNCSCTGQEMTQAMTFFKSVEKDVVNFLNLKHNKPNLPEQHDLEILVSCHNLDLCDTHLVSDDSHFVAYETEIENSQYRVRILPVKDLNQTLDSLRWPNPR